MPKISALTPVKSLAVEFDGGVIINVEYNSGFLTPEVEDRILAIPESERGEANKDLMGIYSNLIMGWDLTDEDDKPVGTTADDLYKVPYPITNHVVAKIREALRPNETSGE